VAVCGGATTGWVGRRCHVEMNGDGRVIRCFVVEGTSFVCVQLRRRREEWLLLSGFY
jgi:hypothetical protein